MKKITALSILAVTVQAAYSQWSADPAVNLETSSHTSSVILTSPTSTGGTYIALYKPNGSGFFDMVVQYLDADGNKKLGADGITLNSYPANTATFVYNVMTDAQDNLILAFQDQRAGGSSNSAVAYKINTAGQSLWETTAGTGDGLLLGGGLAPYPCQLSNGDYIFAWNNNSNRISYQKITAAGALAWGTPQEIQPITTGRTISRPQVVAHTGGKWGMVFQQRNGTVGSPTPTTLFQKQFDADGNQIWTSTALSNHVTANVRYYSVLAVGDLTYIGYYGNPAGQNRFDGFVQRVNGDGTLPWGINGSDFSTEQLNYEQVINIVYNSAAAEIWAIQTYSNTSQTQYGVYAQRFDAGTGARQLTDNAKQLLAVSATRQQTWPTGMGLTGDGGLLFMYFSDVSNNIFAAKINAAGDFLWLSGGMVLCSTAAAKGRYNFSVAGNMGVAVWQETRAGNTRAYAQAITSGGVLGSLPIHVVCFRGQRAGDVHELHWQLSPVSTLFGQITLEQGGDGRNFTGIYQTTVPAARMQQPFQYINRQLLHGNNYYRLKLRDDNGAISYSQVITLPGNTATLQITGCHPNPVTTGQTMLFLTSPAAAGANIIITDTKGRQLLRQTNNINAGANRIQLNLHGLPPGVYQLKIYAAGASGTIQLVKQ